MENWQMMILLFFAMSFIGWVMEVSCKWFEFGRFVNRGFLIGPYCPIYGVGSALIILLLECYAASPLLVFVLTMVICGTLEYLTSYGMEKLFHARWWDYSHKRFNINGRVCAGTLIPFGLLGLLLIYGIKPVLYRWFDRIPSSLLTPLCIVLMLLLAVDAIISTTVLGKIRQSANLTGGDDTETLTRAICETLGRQNALLRRTLRAFPYARIYNNRLLMRFKAGRQKLAKEAAARRHRLREEMKQYDQIRRAELAMSKRQKCRRTKAAEASFQSKEGD